MLVTPKKGLYVYCHRPSRSARVLKDGLKEQGLRARRLYGLDPPFRSLPCVNWGCSTMQYQDRHSKVLNDPVKVKQATWKLTSIPLLQTAGISTVKITQSGAEALKWADKEYSILHRRDGLSGGLGINDASNYDQFEDCNPGHFYARVYRKTHEFRVHVVGGLVVDLVQKKREDGQEADTVIRTHANGWIYAHDNLVLVDQQDLDTLGNLAKRSVEALGLDFGAVDILAKVSKEAPRRLSEAVVCEVNTAPGLENTRTIQAYASNLRRLVL